MFAFSSLYGEFSLTSCFIFFSVILLEKYLGMFYWILYCLTSSYHILLFNGIFLSQILNIFFLLPCPFFTPIMRDYTTMCRSGDTWPETNDIMKGELVPLLDNRWRYVSIKYRYWHWLENSQKIPLSTKINWKDTWLFLGLMSNLILWYDSKSIKIHYINEVGYYIGTYTFAFSILINCLGKKPLNFQIISYIHTYLLLPELSPVCDGNLSNEINNRKDVPNVGIYLLLM